MRTMEKNISCESSAKTKEGVLDSMETPHFSEMLSTMPSISPATASLSVRT